MIDSLVGRLRRYVDTVDTDLTDEGHGWALFAVATGWLLVLGVRFLVPTLLPAIKTEFGVSNAATASR